MHPRRFVFLVCLSLPLALGAADKADPTGTWKWTVTGPDGNKIDITAKFKLEGGKLTGSLTRDGKDAALEEPKFKDDEISFQVTREFNGQKFVPKYKGKLTGDTIKGKIEVDIAGETRSIDWEAKREKK